MTARYQEIVEALAAEHDIELCYGCTCLDGYVFRGHGRAHAHVEDRKACLSVPPKGYVSFFTALHEIGHIVEPGASYRTAPTRAVAEFRATEFAKRTCRLNGIPVKRKVAAVYDRYVKNKVARGLRRGLKKVPAELRRLAKGVSSESYF